MIDIKQLFWKKKLQLFFLFYVLLILPLLTPLAQNIPIQDICKSLCVNIIFFFSIAAFSFFLTPRTEKIVYTILLIISVFPGSVFLSYLLFARVLLEQNSITSLFETNPEESKEFLMHYLNIWAIVGGLIYVFIPVVMIWKMKSYRPLKVRRYKLIFSLSLTLILLIVSISRLSQSIYFINFYNTFASYKVRLYHENKEIERRQHVPYGVRSMLSDSVPQTIVVVIGESLTRNHMQLYGYGRKTNPLLNAMGDDLYVYEDVISPQVHTIPVIRSVFTFHDKENPDSYFKKPSLFELFNRAGYETYFISNQSFGRKTPTSYDALLALAEHKHDLTPQKRHDEVVVEELEKALKDTVTKNKFIVIHLLGNHMAYKFRYPQQYNLFDNDKDHFIKDAPYVTNEAKDAMDEYDNSVAFNDYVVAEIISKLNMDTERKSAMVYFSDHGEELYDFRHFAGHAYEKVSAYMCEVPFVFWASSDFLSDRNDISIDEKRPYSTVDFINSVSNLAGLEFADYESRKSIFSTDFKPSQRYVGDIPYNDLKK